MKEKDAIKLIGIIHNAKKCEKKLIEFGNARNNKPRVLPPNSKEYELYIDWVKTLSDLIDDIEKTKYLFDENDCLKIKDFFNQSLSIPTKYEEIVQEIDWNKHQKKDRGIITLRMLLDAFRDKQTHSISCEKEAEYKLFCLVADEIILTDLFNIVSTTINHRTQILTDNEKELLIKLDSDNIVMFYKIQEMFSTPEYKEMMNSLDDSVYGEHKKRFQEFTDLKINKDNIKLEKKDN